MKNFTKRCFPALLYVTLGWAGFLLAAKLTALLPLLSQKITFGTPLLHAIGTPDKILARCICAVLLLLPLPLLCRLSRIHPPRKGEKSTRRRVCTAALLVLLTALTLANAHTYKLSVPQAILLGVGLGVVGLMEELMFRFGALNLLLRQQGNTVRGQLFAVTASSVLFGLMHLGNLLGDTGLPVAYVLMQVVLGCCFGLLCAALTLRTGRIRWCILLHSCHNGVAMLTNASGAAQSPLPLPLTLLCAVVLLLVAFGLARRILARKTLPDLFHRTRRGNPLRMTGFAGT